MKPLYEDNDIVVIEKPSGEEVSLTAKRVEGILVHRLDRDTSGVMVLAKTDDAAEKLRRQFEERKVVKKYIAMVHGQMKEMEGLITKPLAKNPKNRARVVVGQATDRSAITEWKVKTSYRNYSLLELTPHTGRTHQLRVHLKSIGHPIVSDPIYGYRKKLKSDLTWCPRLFLHANSLHFLHPVTNQPKTYSLPLSADLEVVLTGLT